MPQAPKDADSRYPRCDVLYSKLMVRETYVWQQIKKEWTEQIAIV